MTPELAAQIVKNYVLPMFDNSKKLNKKKTVGMFGDLKLTDQLYDQLNEVK